MCSPSVPRPGKPSSPTAGLSRRTGPADGAPAGADSDPASSPDRMPCGGPEVTPRWLERRAAELREVLIAAAAEDIGVLLDLARSPRELGAAIAGLPVCDGAPAGWSAEDIPQLTVPGWTGQCRRPARPPGPSRSRDPQ